LNKKITPKYDIKKLEHMAIVLKAVAHPLRIATIDLLIQKDEMSVSEIHTTLDILQPEASRQLAILKNAGLIESRKDANTRFYTLTDSSISDLLMCIENCKT